MTLCVERVGSTPVIETNTLDCCSGEVLSLGGTLCRKLGLGLLSDRSVRTIDIVLASRTITGEIFDAIAGRVVRDSYEVIFAVA
jgi:hypothetical protein